MTDLAAIVARDARYSPWELCEACQEYSAGPAEADRRALLVLLRETREALDDLRVNPRSGRANARALQTLGLLRPLAALAEP